MTPPSWLENGLHAVGLASRNVERRRTTMSESRAVGLTTLGICVPLLGLLVCLYAQMVGYADGWLLVVLAPVYGLVMLWHAGFHFWVANRVDGVNRWTMVKISASHSGARGVS